VIPFEHHGAIFQHYLSFDAVKLWLDCKASSHFEGKSSYLSYSWWGLWALDGGRRVCELSSLTLFRVSEISKEFSSSSSFIGVWLPADDSLVAGCAKVRTSTSARAHMSSAHNGTRRNQCSCWLWYRNHSRYDRLWTPLSSQERLESPCLVLRHVESDD